MNKFLAVFALLFAPVSVFAHEAYVLKPEQFQAGLGQTSFDALGALKNSGNLKTFAIIALSILALLILNFWFRRTSAGRSLSDFLERFSRFGLFIVRVAISASLFFSALTSSFLGPELPLYALPFGGEIRIVLFIISFMFLLGIFTELAALIALSIYALAFWRFGFYLATYLNYFGELVTLLFLGFRYFSLDKFIFGAKKSFAFLKPYESAIVRVCYGLGLIYAAITIKFLHPILTVTVVNQYHLTQFHWLFPSDPLLVTFGAALAEMFIGLFIVFGFEMRLTVFISLIYITLSLLYFREAVWPHFLLYGISINLIINKESFTLDDFFDRRLKKNPSLNFS